MKNTAGHDQIRRVAEASMLVRPSPDRPGASFPFDATSHMQMRHPDHETPQTGVARGLVPLVQVGGGDLVAADNALGDALAGELDVDAD
jgi:hypothetical protein